MKLQNMRVMKLHILDFITFLLSPHNSRYSLKFMTNILNRCFQLFLYFPACD